MADEGTHRLVRCVAHVDPEKVGARPEELFYRFACV
jgi:hypothetical protein